MKTITQNGLNKIVESFLAENDILVLDGKVLEVDRMGFIDMIDYGVQELQLDSNSLSFGNICKLIKKALEMTKMYSTENYNKILKTIMFKLEIQDEIYVAEGVTMEDIQEMKKELNDKNN